MRGVIAALNMARRIHDFIYQAGAHRELPRERPRGRGRHASSVQHLAGASLDTGPAIIANAGLSFKNATGPVKSGFVVKHGKVSGTARLIARAEGTRASYDWQYSPNRGTWLSLKSTVQANQQAYGLVPGRVYFFRCRSLTKAGTGDWSELVSLLML
jgi:hypothetical protein